VLDAASGAVVAEFDPVEDGLGPTYFVYGGDWQGDQVAVSAGWVKGRVTHVGVALLRRDAAGLSLHKLVSLRMPALESLYLPVRLGGTGLQLRLVTLHDDSYRYLDAECDLAAQRCVSVSAPIDPMKTTIADNPSRGSRP
jgi:hypothetical protein